MVLLWISDLELIFILEAADQANFNFGLIFNLSLILNLKVKVTLVLVLILVLICNYRLLFDLGAEDCAGFSFSFNV